MALGRKGLTRGAIKGLTECWFYYGAMCLCFTVFTMLCMAGLCTAIQSSVHKLTGRRTVLFTESSPPH
ncbi:unnamed protein product, partial [Staurois parvus]